jgi:hypothetical protein
LFSGDSERWIKASFHPLPQRTEVDIQLVGVELSTDRVYVSEHRLRQLSMMPTSNSLASVIVAAGMGSSEGTSMRSLHISIHPLITWVCIVVLALRVWAVWGKSVKLGVALVLFYIFCWGSALIVMGITAANQHSESFLSLGRGGAMKLTLKPSSQSNAPSFIPQCLYHRRTSGFASCGDGNVSVL